MAMIQTLCSDFIFCQFSHHAVDPNLELSWWGSFHLLVLLAFLPLVILSFLPKIRRGWGSPLDLPLSCHLVALSLVKDN